MVGRPNARLKNRVLLRSAMKRDDVLALVQAHRDDLMMHRL
jgi:hypothetical protein